MGISLATDAEVRAAAEQVQNATKPQTIETIPTGSNGGDEGERTDKPTKATRLFGGLTASEAGQRSAQRRAERDRDAETHAAQARSDETLIVRTTVSTGKIIARLSRDAAGGNVQAARELRGWLSEVQVEADTDLSSLDKRTRQALLAQLLAQVSDGVMVEAGSIEGGSASTLHDPPTTQGDEG